MGHETSEVTGFAIDITPGGTLTDLSGDINSAQLTGSKELLDDTGLGDSRRTRISGLAGPTGVVINGWHNSTTRGAFPPNMFDSDTSRTIEVLLASGEYWTGECFPESGTPFGSSVGAVNTFSVNWSAENGLTQTSITAVV